MSRSVGRMIAKIEPMATRTQTDQTLYCDRCGIAFLWSREEQGSIEPQKAESPIPAVKPVHCPGCRHLLPAENRERGIVDWFNSRQRYGFITRLDGEDIFVHRTEVHRHTRLRTGDLVEFTAKMGRQGTYASDVTLLMRQPKSSEQNA